MSSTSTSPRSRGDFIQGFYSNVLELQRTPGTHSAPNLSDREKQALIAFLATL